MLELIHRGVREPAKELYQFVIWNIDLNDRERGPTGNRSTTPLFHYLAENKPKEKG